MSRWAIVVAAGSGERFGGPKQFADLAGCSVLARSLRTVAAFVDGLVVVAAPDLVERTRLEAHGVAPEALVVAGGPTRSASVRNGLAEVPAEATTVLVHDAARPLASPVLYEAVIGALDAGAAAVVPGIAVHDTIRSLDGGVVDRARLVAVQTPQGFRADALRAAHHESPEATDDASLVESTGCSVVVVAGESTNLKITTPTDLVIARALVESVEVTSSCE